MDCHGCSDVGRDDDQAEEKKIKAALDKSGEYKYTQVTKTPAEDGKEAKEEKKEVTINKAAAGDSDEAKAAQKEVDKQVKIAATYAAFDDEKFQKSTADAVFKSIRPTLLDSVNKALAAEEFENVPAKVGLSSLPLALTHYLSLCDACLFYSTLFALVHMSLVTPTSGQRFFSLRWPRASCCAVSSLVFLFLFFFFPVLAPTL